MLQNLTNQDFLAQFVYKLKFRSRTTVPKRLEEEHFSMEDTVLVGRKKTKFFLPNISNRCCTIHHQWRNEKREREIGKEEGEVGRLGGNLRWPPKKCYILTWFKLLCLTQVNNNKSNFYVFMYYFRQPEPIFLYFWISLIL